MGKSLNQAKANAIRYTKKKVEHWQLVSLALAGYDAISIIIAFFLALWFRFDCRYSMIPLFRSDRLKDSGSVPVFLIHIEEQFGILWKFLDPLIQKRREESLTAEFRICKGGALKQKVVHRNKSDGGDDAPVVFRKKKQGCILKRERERGVIVSCACIYHGLDLVFPERI